MLKRLLCTWHAPEKAEEAWIPKERIVILKVAELSVLGCRGPSTLVSSPLLGGGLNPEFHNPK